MERASFSSIQMLDKAADLESKAMLADESLGVTCNNTTRVQRQLISLTVAELGEVVTLETTKSSE